MIKIWVSLCSFIVFLTIELVFLPKLESLLGPNLLKVGPGWLLFPALASYLSWVLLDELTIHTLLCKAKLIAHSLQVNLKFYTLLILGWSAFIVLYFIFAHFFAAQFPIPEWLTWVICILIPPLVILTFQTAHYLMRYAFNSKMDDNRVGVFGAISEYIRENVNTLPAILQLITALLLISTILNLSVPYHQFVALLTFVTAWVSMWDAYKNEENFHTALFITIACLYNPFYPIPFSAQVWMIFNLLIACIFAYDVSAILKREKRIDKMLLTIGMSIHAHLQEIDNSTSEYTIKMLEKFIKHKYPYLTQEANSTIKWQEKDLKDFTFSILDVFNGHAAIRVAGKNGFRGFIALLVFYNLRVRRLIFLEKEATTTAKRLRKMMAKEWNYFCFEKI